MIILLINMSNDIVANARRHHMEAGKALKGAIKQSSDQKLTLSANKDDIESSRNSAKKTTLEDSLKVLHTSVDSLKAEAHKLKSSLLKEEEEEEDVLIPDLNKLDLDKCYTDANSAILDEKTRYTQHTGNLINTYLNTKFNNAINDLNSTKDQAMLLNDIMDSKNLLNKGFEKDLNLKKTLNSKNKNYIITMQRLSQFYSRNINSQTSINNIFKIVLIILSIGAVFLLKTDIKEILKGTLSNKSIFIKPLLPTIISVVGLIVYLVYLFNNKNIHEISPIIFLSIIIFIIYIQYMTIKLQSIKSPIIPVLYGIALLPYIILFIIEKLNLNHNIIPIHDKNTNLSFKINDDITNLKRDNANLDVILSKYKEYQEEYLGG